MRIIANLVPTLSVYTIRDYRRFLSAHLQFLKGLCELSIRSVNQSIGQGLSSLLITNQLLSKETFQIRIDTMANSTRSNALVALNRLVLLLRTTNHGDAIVSSYGTNFQYMDPAYKNQTRSIAYTESVTYDQNCSCDLSFTCFTDASFIDTNSTESKKIKGLKMGCTPSESFLASNLQCFHDVSCIDLIEEMTNTANIDMPMPLNLTSSRFSIHATVNELVNELFVETWSTTKNYSLYFNQCSPIFCSYSYTQSLNLMYTVNYILGLFGGLTIVFKWICPKMVSLMNKAIESRRRRTRHIGPVPNIEATVVAFHAKSINPKSAHTIIVNLQSVPTVSTHPFVSFTLIKIVVHFSIFQS